MRNNRNPRYCPESLEKRLSPSAMPALPPVQAQVQLAMEPAPPAHAPSAVAGMDDPNPPYDPTQPFPPPPPPPPVPPGGPSGPDLASR